MVAEQRREARRYDAVVVVSFGGPEGPGDVLPFLENVTRGRNVPRERLLEVARQYELFGGVSPLPAQNRTLVAALEAELAADGLRLPVYLGNRNWHPFLSDTVAEMTRDGVRRALAFVTSAYSSYSGCRQYIEDIERARRTAGERAPVIDKLRAFWNHPGFIEPMAANVRQALEGIPAEQRPRTRLAFTGHSIPLAMAATCDYAEQLRDAARLVVERVPDAPPWQLVYQSRSGPPAQPWLEPDVVEHIEALASEGVSDVVVVPIGFLSDHMEVVYDLDTKARERCEEIGVNLVRARTVGNDPRFVAMIRELIIERVDAGRERRFLGTLGLRPDVCPPGCCPSPARPAV